MATFTSICEPPYMTFPDQMDRSLLGSWSCQPAMPSDLLHAPCLKEVKLNWVMRAPPAQLAFESRLSYLFLLGEHFVHLRTIILSKFFILWMGVSNESSSTINLGMALCSASLLRVFFLHIHWISFPFSCSASYVNLAPFLCKIEWKLKKVFCKKYPCS